MTKEELKKEAEDNKPPYAFCALDTKCELWKYGFQRGAEPREKRIEELEKENAELKARLQKKINTTTVSDYPYSALKLEEAKEIIKKFSEFTNNEIEYDPEHPQEHTDLWNKLCEQAEQFLKEVEK